MNRSDTETPEIENVYRVVSVKDLKLDPKNARDHSDESLEAVKKSLARFGQQKAISIDKDLTVLAGNGTLMAARELGWKTIECRISALTHVEATAYGIADNRTQERSKWNYDQLQENIDFLKTSEFDDLGALGFTESQIANIANGSADENFFHDLSKSVPSEKMDYDEAREKSLEGVLVLTGSRDLITEITSALKRIREERGFITLAEAAASVLSGAGVGHGPNRD